MGLTEEERYQILTGHYRLIRDVKLLPDSVRKAFTDADGVVMANPGEQFEEGCIRRRGHPYQRLTFALLSKDKCLVHFEQGGRGLFHAVKVFALPSGTTATLR